MAEEKAVDRRLWVADLQGNRLGWLVSNEEDSTIYLCVPWAGARSVLTKYYLDTDDTFAPRLLTEESAEEIEIQWASPPAE